MGGFGPERAISVATGEAVYAALVEAGCDVYRIFVDRDVDLVLRQLRIQTAFLALHGDLGEDGSIQGLLEVLGIPYTGSGVLASALAMDKIKTKEVLRLRNLPVAASYVCDAPGAEDPHERHGEFGYPCVVKPADCGSSVGVSVVRDPVELACALELAGRFSGRILVERYVGDQEVSVAVLDGQALGAIEVAPRLGFFDYANKYTHGRTDYYFPARLSSERYRGVLELGEQAHQALGCAGLTRVDLRLSDLGNEAILEVNTLPGLSPHSLIPKIADACGLTYQRLCLAVLERARLHGARAGEASRPREDREPGVAVRGALGTH
jgi:D-alanine-D-alanine ligase